MAKASQSYHRLELDLEDMLALLLALPLAALDIGIWWLIVIWWLS